MHTFVKTWKFFILSALLSALPAHAADYKTWLPLFPETVGGLSPSGKPKGVNMEMGEQSWSSAEQKYGKAPRTVQLAIVSGVMAPQTQMFQGLSKMKIETQDEVVTTTTVAGYQSVLQFNRKRKKGTLMVQVKPQSLVIVEATQVADQSELTKIANDIPFARIAEATN